MERVWNKEVNASVSPSDGTGSKQFQVLTCRCCKGAHRGAKEEAKGDENELEEHPMVLGSSLPARVV